MHRSSPRSTTSDLSRDGDKEKSLTPQRKHRKLMKDGTSEVWPESVERIFVEGLRQYWESPWATYSRGRSRWRNQFLVDYLQKNGIERTKKQVASHIQVLRNMWKGEPEFHLVAGGEELFLETGLLAPVKSEDTEMGTVPGPQVGDSATSPSSTFSSPDYAFDQCLQMPSSPQSDNASPSTRYPPELPREAPARRHPPFDNFPRSDASARSDPMPLPYQHARPRLPSTHSHRVGDRGASPMFQSNQAMSVSPPSGSPAQMSPVSMYMGGGGMASPFAAPVSLASVSLMAEGIAPLVLPVENPQPTYGAAPERVAVRIKLHIPSIDDLRCPATMHGWHGNVAFSGSWTTSAVCATTVYKSGVIAASETNPLQPFTSPSMSGGVGLYTSAALPESPLSRSRWLEAGPTQIVQQLVLDGVTVAVLVYDIDRRVSTGVPAAELVSIQRKRPERPSTAPAPRATPPNPSSPYAHTMHSPPLHAGFPSYFPHHAGRSAESTSLSCALTPVSSSRGAPAYATRPHAAPSILF